MRNMGEVIVIWPVLRKNLFRFLKIPPGFPGNHLGKRLVEMGKKRFLNLGKVVFGGGKWYFGGGVEW
jgi:hypothetical protein